MLYTALTQKSNRCKKALILKLFITSLVIQKHLLINSFFVFALAKLVNKLKKGYSSKSL